MLNTSLITSEMQIKNTMRCNFISISMAIIKKPQKITIVDKDMETLEPLYITGGNVKR